MAPSGRATRVTSRPERRSAAARTDRDCRGAAVAGDEQHRTRLVLSHGCDPAAPERADDQPRNPQGGRDRGSHDGYQQSSTRR